MTGHVRRYLLFFALLLIGAVGEPATAAAQSSGSFTRTADMTTARSQHTATLLTSGKVLITGGTQSGGFSGLATAELYDPKSGTFAPTGNMATARRMHTATRLPDGRVLIVGGYGTAGVTLSSAEFYDPSSGTFSAAGNMMTARGGHSAILLPSSKVLIVGGYGTNAYPDVAPAEIYDPSSGTFTGAAEYVGRGGCDFCAPAVLLTDGTVLFAGQYPAQLYDPVADSFTPAGMMVSEQSAATVLTSGKVLFAGGVDLSRSAKAELYDPDMHTFTAIAGMAWRRDWHSLTLLPNGQALVAGGETESCAANACTFAGSVATAELYDPATATFIPTADMTAKREIHTATLLGDGRVLIAGGDSYGGIGIYYGSTASAELYVPDVLIPAPALAFVSGTSQGAIYHAGTSHLAGSDDPATVGELVDLSCSGLDSGSAIPPQVSIGDRLAQVISFRQPGTVPGTNQIRVRVPAGVAPGNAVPVRLIYLDRPSNAVTVAIR
jgi:Galactose oxidase, central domain